MATIPDQGGMEEPMDAPGTGGGMDEPMGTPGGGMDEPMGEPGDADDMPGGDTDMPGIGTSDGDGMNMPGTVPGNS